MQHQQQRLNCSVVVLLLLFLLSSVASDEDTGVNCEWKYKCELVWSREPFVCGRWAPEAEKICPTTVPPPAAADDDEVVATSFQMIRAPCTHPFMWDRAGKCRKAFV